MNHIKGLRSTVQHPHVILAFNAARDFTIGALFLYGYIYTAYKYGNPLFWRNDFFEMYSFSDVKIAMASGDVTLFLHLTSLPFSMDVALVVYPT